jgi:hypothetical protein
MKKYLNSIQASVSTTIAGSAPAANVPTVGREQVNIPTQTFNLPSCKTENTELRNSAVQLALEILELRSVLKGSIESLVAGEIGRSGLSVVVSSSHSRGTLIAPQAERSSPCSCRIRDHVNAPAHSAGCF